MKKIIKLKIIDFILIAFELILCGILISQVIFNDFPLIPCLLLILLILFSGILINYLSYRDSQKLN
jgi:uncharacterized membrane protein YcaP (DUF421 family)